MCNRKFTAIILAAVLTIASTCTYAEAENKAYSLKDLTEIMLNESQDVKTIDINTQLIDVQNESSIKDYNDMKDTVQQLEVYLSGLDENMRVLNAKIKDSRSPEEQTGYINARDNLIGSNYLSSLERYRNRVKAYVTMMKNMEPALLQKKQAPKLKDNQTEVSKYNFQKDYYNLLSLDRQLQLARTDYDNTNKQLDTEKIKSNYGMTTNVNIEDIEQQKRTLETSVNDLQNSIELAKENMKTKLNMDSTNDLNVKYEIPALTASDTKDYSLVLLLSNFRANNTELESQTLSTKMAKDANDKYQMAYIVNKELVVNPDALTKEDQATVKTMGLLSQKAQIDEINLKRSMDTYVKNTYFAYKKAKADFLSSISNRKLYEQKKAIADSNYRQGMISKLQYDLQIQDLNKKIFDADKAVIAFDNARMLIEMVNKGVYLK